MGHIIIRLNQMTHVRCEVHHECYICFHYYIQFVQAGQSRLTYHLRFTYKWSSLAFKSFF